MIRVAVSGALGEMGQRVCSQVNAAEGMELVSLLERPGHELAGLRHLGVGVTDSPEEASASADVIIDFSSAEASAALAALETENNPALVICSTGISGAQRKGIEEASVSRRILLSPNMSLGVNLMFKIAALINSALPGYEREIVEAHHNRKKDAPSGTAAELLRVISDDGAPAVYGREGLSGPRTRSEIGVHSVRGGNIVGDHTVMWIGEADCIELRHHAQSRDIFAEGSVRAAAWLVRQAPGRLYDMHDVIG